MAVLAARRALEPAVAEALEALGFTRDWPVYVQRHGQWPGREGLEGPHRLAWALGLGGEPQQLSTYFLGGLSQWPFEQLPSRAAGDRSRRFDLRELRLVRDTGPLMEPRGDVHAFLLDGVVVPEQCAIRVVISNDGFHAFPHVRWDERAPIYTQVEWGERESDASRFWSYSRKGF